MAVKRVIRVDVPALEIPRADLQSGNEYLQYTLTVSGAQGKFAVVDNANRSVMKDTDYQTPQHVYRRKWPQSPTELPPEDDQTYTLAISFVTATKYRYLVQRHRRDGSVVETIKDMDFESDDPSDKDFTAFRIFFT